MRKRLEFTQQDEDESEGTLLPIITIHETDEADFKQLPEMLALLPLRNTVLFPGVVIPITVGRSKSIQLIKDAKKQKKLIGVVSQKDVSVEDPSLADLSPIATAAEILRLVRMPDGNITAMVQGKKRFYIGESVSDTPYLVVKTLPLTDAKQKNDKEMKAIIASLKETAIGVIQLSSTIQPEAALAIHNITSANFLINFVASNLSCETADKQRILEITDLKERAKEVLVLLSKDLQVAELKTQIQSKARGDMDKQQREYYLNQQLKTIQEELGGITPEADAKDIKERAAKMKWNAETAAYFNKELLRLHRINPASPDYSVVVNHLELMLELPWNEFTKDNFDLKRAEKILNGDHYGLQKIKKRILEYLAVIKLKNDMRSPILCLVGPPGVGKTSLGKSIAKALGRKYVRMSLGGVHDEAAIRGHRKTYIGAMPGRVIQSLKKAQSNNPVFLLDEIDKAGSDVRGDVSSALLEVLDPEQNYAFNDHYLEADYDLSRVMFVATANALSHVQPALLDRMEIIQLSGYTLEEKIEIAKRHLLPKQIKEHGLTTKDLKLNLKAIECLIEGYTREAGVRNLEKQIAALCRGIAKMKVLDEPYTKTIDEAMVIQVLGAKKIEKDAYQGNDVAGVVTGLAWTSVGGEILFIESSLSRGKGRVVITGNLGEVMKESATIALAYIRANSDILDIKHELFDSVDINIHVPEGATPKDGPSAGVTMLTSLVSSFTQSKIKPHLAMTGEITLRGKVLPVGGIKEKILAAKRAGIKEILLSERNRKDILEIEEQYIAGLKFHYVENMMQVLDIALLKTRVANAKNLIDYIPQKTLPTNPK